MVRLIAIVLLIALAFILIRYRTNQKLQKGVGHCYFGRPLFYYTTFLVISELIR
ncbi:membrane protein [Vibrio metoecus]|uniref:Membrane protein n=1 Tax=Vibrio metoecus TaxID=1481663 RepID=A0A0Q0JMS9_VIBMT|nr:membrane protein [Vibrio metoecus]